jgi:hypothetical protein
MPGPTPVRQRRRRRPTQTSAQHSILRASLIGVVGLAVAACSTPSASPSPTTRPTPTVATSASPTPSPAGTPSPTPEPSFSLELPQTADTRLIGVKVAVAVPPKAVGRITVGVTNRSATRIDEIVLRWATPIREVLFLHPFVPSKERIVDGGPPLRQEWTKWVEGPGALGEPAGTTSLGYGPIDAGVTLTIPLYVDRTAPGPIAFDVQFLAGEKILTIAGGKPAVSRVTVP